jgi:adenine/guanine phosphoribosyltransferase-like PRPP-binding protein
MSKFIECENALQADYPFGLSISANAPLIDELIKGFLSIEEFKGKQINLLCTGSSGAIVAALFSMKVPNTKIIHIKKDGENSHHKNGWYQTDDFANSINVIVDDFISSGKTVNNIVKELRNRAQIHCLCVTGYVRVGKLNFEPDYVVAKFFDK